MSVIGDAAALVVDAVVVVPVVVVVVSLAFFTLFWALALFSLLFVLVFFIPEEEEEEENRSSESFDLVVVPLDEVSVVVRVILSSLPVTDFVVVGASLLEAEAETVAKEAGSMICEVDLVGTMARFGGCVVEIERKNLESCDVLAAKG